MTIHFVCAFVRNRAESPEAHSPGQRPVVKWRGKQTPCKGKSANIIMLLPLQGELPPSVYPRAMPWAKCNLALSGRIPLFANRHSGAFH